MVEQERTNNDSDAKPLACYGLLARRQALPSATLASEHLLLRFVDVRPVSSVTIDFVSWCSQPLAATGKTA